MSSHPDGYEVEDYVYEAWMNLTDEQYQFIIDVYERNPEIKSYIEDAMWDYDEWRHGSWRDYRNGVAARIDEYWEEERKIIDGYIYKEE